MVDVLGIGVVAVDDLVYVDHFPAPDSKVPVSSMCRQGGGLTATALVAAARLGSSAMYCTRLGDDELSRYTIGELEREGVDCSQILFDPQARPYHSVVIVDLSTGSRTILYTGEGVTRPTAEEINLELVATCRVLFFDHHLAEVILPAAHLARNRGIAVMADIENVNAPGVDATLPLIDHLILGVEQAARLSGETEPARMVRALAAPHHRCLAVTAGARGCWYTDGSAGGAVHHLPAFVVQVVDTTGCGDVFHGAYAAALAAGEETRRAIRMATGAAGLKAQLPGGRAGIPDRGTLERFLAEYIDEDHIVPT